MFRDVGTTVNIAILAACVVVLCGCQQRRESPIQQTDSSPSQAVEENGHDLEQKSSTKRQPSGKIDTDYWKLSNECAEAAARFWKMAGYHDRESLSNYTNHFNKQLGKCLIRLRDTTTKSGGKLVTDDRIYDAVEHVEFMEYVEWPMTGSAILTSDGKPIPDTPENRARMDALMQQ